MELMQVMGNRRSIRYFEPEKPVEKEKVQVMLEAMNRASRAVNADFVKVVVVYRDELDPEVLQQLKTPTTTAEIDMGDGMTIDPQRAHKFRQQRESVIEWLQRGDLTADMHVDAGDFKPWELCGARIHAAGAADRNAKFVLGLAGRDLGVCPRVNVRIDAQ